MKISTGWDSGPYGLYYEPPLHGDSVVEVPDEVWARYQAANKEKWAAQDALDEAIARAQA